MSTDATGNRVAFTPFEQLRYARDILRTEAQALLTMGERLQDEFLQAVQLLYHCQGNVIVSGMGKAGLVGQKIVATLASTGTRAHFLHPAEAIHGDLGRIHQNDVLLFLSYSGETEEVVRILPAVREFGAPIVAVTGNRSSQLGKAATLTLDLGPIREACALGLAPSTSTTAMIALGDALALVVSRMRHFGPNDFARFHPGGSLGRKLAKVEELMRPLAECRVASDEASVREILVTLRRPGRRSGAIMLIDEREMLTGIFTDSDLARLLERKQDMAIDGPIRNVMTHAPKSVTVGSLMSEAVTILASRKISELPVVDAEGHPVGLIDITDVLNFLPRHSASEVTESEQLTSSVAENVDATIVPFPQR